MHRRTKIQRAAGRRLRAGNRRGVAAVEFAIVAPVFFLLVIGFVELGRGLMVQQVLTNASRVGAREAISLHSSTTSAKSAAEDYADGCSVSGVAVSVSPDPASASAGDVITVSVTVPYADISWVPSPWFMGGSTLEATSSMRKEGFE
ncbi:TadE/TadG family type IV pilus assembly protein [Aeoliella sp.]|uniref:TadE/TadG family type IV pilus assembly protein n=1 Tax=Aeoliella sp. TaxID=2795800 RepID=UPI003CCBBFF7